MIRNVLGSLVALAGAASAVLSPFRDWYAGRAGQDYRVEDLFGGITAAESGVLVSMLLPFLAAALLVIVGVVLRSRLVVALAGLVVLGFTILWMVRQGQAAGSLVVAGDGSGLQVGVVNALAGGLLMLIGALLMSGHGQQRQAGAGAGGAVCRAGGGSGGHLAADAGAGDVRADVAVAGAGGGPVHGARSPCPPYAVLSPGPAGGVRPPGPGTPAAPAATASAGLTVTRSRVPSSNAGTGRAAGPAENQARPGD